MSYREICWRLFAQSGHPDLYMQYRQYGTDGAKADLFFRTGMRPGFESGKGTPSPV